VQTDSEPDLGGASPDVDVVMEPDVTVPDTEVEMGMAEAASSGDAGGEIGGDFNGSSTNPDVAVVKPEQGGSEPPTCAPGYVWVESGPG